MNTTTCHPAIASAIILRTPRALPQRLWLWLQEYAAAWRAQARARMQLRAQLRSLQGLSDGTLRDIGMAERMPYQPHTLGLLDYERGRWS